MASLEDEFAFKIKSRPPKCLAGISIMLVDDSRSVSEAVRMMATVSGARIRRADCIASAQRHVMLFRPSVVLIDLGLPDGNGVEVARIVTEKVDPRPGILILSAADEDVTRQAAEDCGADGYLLKPIEGLGAFQEAILKAVKRFGKTPVMNWHSGRSFLQVLQAPLAIRSSNNVHGPFLSDSLAGIGAWRRLELRLKCCRLG